MSIWHKQSRASDWLENGKTEGKEKQLYQWSEEKVTKKTITTPIGVCMVNDWFYVVAVWQQEVVCVPTSNDDDHHPNHLTHSSAIKCRVK